MVPDTPPFVGSLAARARRLTQVPANATSDLGTLRNASALVYPHSPQSLKNGTMLINVRLNSERVFGPA